MSAKTPADNYQPRLALQIGVTGHRPKDLLQADLPLLIERIGNALQAVKTVYLEFAETSEAKSIFTIDQPMPPRLLSPLAEGADSLAAQVALDLGYCLHCPLPFSHDDYLEDFKHDPQAQMTFETLLSQASRQLELDGSLANRDKAYLNLGQFVLRHTDILLAVWNGVENDLSPGTAGVVAAAIRQEVPVLLIHAAAPHNIEIHDPRDKTKLWQAWDLQTLAELLRWRLVQFDILLAEEKERQKAEQNDEQKKQHKPKILHKCQQLLGIETNSRKVYFDHPAPHRKVSNAMATVLVSVYRIFFTCFGKRRVKGALGGSYSAGSKLQWKIPNRAAEHNLWLQSSTKTHFLHADSLGSYYAEQYRGTFVLSFALGAIAVLSALFGAPFKELSHSGFPFAVTELVLILSIAGLITRGSILALHQRWLDFRLLAERLRQYACLQAVGGVSQWFLPAFYSKSDNSHAWIDWLVRSINRSEGIPALVFDQTYRKRYRAYLYLMIRDQVKYHALNAQRNEHIAHALHNFNLVFLVMIIIACSMHIACGVSFINLPHKLCHDPILEASYTVVAAAFPAFGAAVAGMLSQGEFERIAQRSKGMAEQLQEIADNLKRSPDASVSELSLQAHNAIAIMSQELSDWRVIFRAKPLEWHA